MALPKRAGKDFVLLGPAEADLHAYFVTRLKDLEILVCPERERLLSILGNAGLYVGHDSGITHLSAMLGTPTIALFKESLVHRWRPLGPAVKVIRHMEPGPRLIARIIEEARDLGAPWGR